MVAVKQHLPNDDAESKEPNDVIMASVLLSLIVAYVYPKQQLRIDSLSTDDLVHYR